ncbi:MAG: flagellar filament capping protein FliD [Acidobacteriota bacterium]|nr:flagellar filament capping protein FliD [Acidobacteriota bacterium]
MSTPISAADLGAIVAALTQYASAPPASLQVQLPDQPASGYGATLAADVAALQTAAGDLGAAGSLTGTGATNTAPGAVALSVSVAPPQDAYYSVVVNSLAQAQITSSSSTYTDSNATTVASGGSLTIGGVSVNVSGSTTLQGLADAINGTADIGVTASVAPSSAGQYSLVLTGNRTGAANAFTITNDLTGGAGITFGANTQDATDASVTVDGVTTTSATNTIGSVIPGATLTLLQAGASAAMTLTTAVEAPDAATLVQNFVTAYNNLRTLAQSQPAASLSGGLTSSTSSGLLGSLMAALNSQLAGTSATDGTYPSLAQVGIGVDASGNLTFDSGAFDSAVASTSLTDIQNLFSGPGGSGGVFSTITATIDSYVAAGGLAATPQTPASPDLQSLNGQIASLQNQLALEQQLLQQQSLAADSTVSSLTSQGRTLTSLSQQYGGASSFSYR